MYKINTKEEKLIFLDKIRTFYKENNINLYNLNNSHKISKFLNNFKVDTDLCFDNEKQLYDYLTENREINCPICNKENRFNRLHLGYYKTCSYDCSRKLAGLNISLNNTTKRNEKIKSGLIIDETCLDKNMYCPICGKKNKILKNNHLKYSKTCSDKCKYELIKIEARKKFEKENPEKIKKQQLHKNKILLNIEKSKTINSKLEIFEFIIENYKSIFNYSDTTLKLKKFLKLYDIKLTIEFNTVKELYDYLTDYKNSKCTICGNESIFINFKKGYKKICSNECLSKYRSNRMTGEKNAFYLMTNETKEFAFKKISTKLKDRIANGTFTPNVTNSWAHSKIEVKLNNDKTVNCRSSWEAFFLIKNPTLLYEKIRIPYEFNNQFHNYILDFVDLKNKIIYEIKPDGLTETKLNKIKFKAAEKWATENNYKFEIIGNDWFKINYDPILLEGQPDKTKMLIRLKQFE